MLELRNRQYMTIIDCIAGEDLEMGHVLKLEDHDDVFVRAVKVAADAEHSAVAGPLLAYWINERSTSVAFSGGEDGLSFPLAPSTDEDAVHYIPSGKRMLAVGGKGVAEVRLFEDSLDSEFDGALPAVGDELHYSTDEAMLCSSGNAQASTAAVGLVLENDGVSVAVLLG